MVSSFWLRLFDGLLSVWMNFQWNYSVIVFNTIFILFSIINLLWFELKKGNKKVFSVFPFLIMLIWILIICGFKFSSFCVGWVFLSFFFFNLFYLFIYLFWIYLYQLIFNTPDIRSIAISLCALHLHFPVIAYISPCLGSSYHL